MAQGEIPFGKYQLLERIATGGMAEIYRARYQAAAGVTKPVVIKKILPSYAGNKNFVSMFINEAKIVVRLSHGNIAQVFDFGEIDGEYFLAMEHVHGQPLSKVLRKARTLGIKALPAPYAVFIAMELCKGLHYAHTRLDDRGRPMNIIHRDVSPQNLILSYEGQVKIVDFGIAKARNAGQTESVATETGAVKGKYVYFAPEQARGRELDARTDVFAAGIVLYEMVCGRLPFEGKMMDVLGRIVRGDFQRPRALVPSLAPALERIILTAMATEKSARFESAQALHNALAQYLYSNAPTFSSSSLASLMSYLFEKELLDQGIPVRVPPDFLAQLNASITPDSSGEPDGPAGPDEPSETTRSDKPRAMARAAEVAPAPAQPDRPGVARPAQVIEPNRFPPSPSSGQAEPALTPSSPTRPLPRWLFFAAPVLAMLLSGTLVFTCGYYRASSLSVTSSPPGALVLVDGQPAPTRTPLLTSGLSAGTEHRLEVRAPGRKPWSSTITPVRGGTIEVHADLEPERPGGGQERTAGPWPNVP